MEKAVFVALDYDNENDVQKLLAKLGKPENTYLKIGMELFYHAGSDLVKKLGSARLPHFFRFKATRYSKHSLSSS